MKLLLPNRYRSWNYLIQEGDSMIFKLQMGADTYLRLSPMEGDEDSYSFVDPSGGPMISIGEPLSGHPDFKVERIFKGREGSIMVELSQIPRGE